MEAFSTLSFNVSFRTVEVSCALGTCTASGIVGRVALASGKAVQRRIADTAINLFILTANLAFYTYICKTNNLLN
jgi:hypothetical protein